MEIRSSKASSLHTLSSFLPSEGVHWRWYTIRRCGKNRCCCGWRSGRSGRVGGCNGGLRLAQVSLQPGSGSQVDLVSPSERRFFVVSDVKIPTFWHCFYRGLCGFLSSYWTSPSADALTWIPSRLRCNCRPCSLNAGPLWMRVPVVAIVSFGAALHGLKRKQCCKNFVEERPVSSSIWGFNVA